MKVCPECLVGTDDATVTCPVCGFVPEVGAEQIKDPVRWLRADQGLFSKLIYKALFTDPHSGNRATFVTAKGHESGLDHLEIITVSKDAKWRHRIYTEEI
jgi:hypothetical protein